MKAFISSLFATVSLCFYGVLATAAPDRIGNGGVVWSCETSDGEILDLMFMDIYEARRLHKLTVPETNEDPLVTVQKQKGWVQNFLPNFIDINDHIFYVERNINWIDEVLVDIPDAANLVIPHPSTCPKPGKWQAVQMVNFTDQNDIYIRKSLFESPLMTDVERAAVYLHEGIYSYLRTEFKDKDSKRTRKIVGLLLSNEKDSDKVSRILAELKQGQRPPPPPEEPKSGFICGIKPGQHTALYTAESDNEKEAKAKAVQECKVGENPFGNDNGIGNPGFPFFPGFPGGEHPRLRECRENRVLCEPITTSQKVVTCVLPDFFDRKEFKGQGRTSLEAQKESMTRCLASEGASNSSCFNFRKMRCN